MASSLQIALIAAAASTPAMEPAAPSISWEQALERASRTAESLLVEVGATWCHACNVLATRTMADSTVRSALSEGWIVVEVDVDRRPDLHRLFHARGHDGLPTLHLLTPDGREVLRSGFVDAAALVGMLRTARRPRSSAELLPEEGVMPTTADDSTPSPEDAVARERAWLFAEEDSTYGGFGRGTKYIVSPETDFLLALSATGDEPARATLRRFTAAVTASAVHDADEGGFHRYSEARDWSAPHYEKLLMVQAVMMEVLATDSRAHPAVREENLAVARETWEFLVSALQDPRSGLFFGSLGADVLDESGVIAESGELYYGRGALPGMISSGYDHEARTSTTGARRSGQGPAADRTLLTDGNARLGSALLLCGDVFEDPTFTTEGLRLLDEIRAELTESEGGLLRYRAIDGNAPAAVEDIAELGMLALAAGQENRERSLALGTRLLTEYVDGEGRLRPQPSGDPFSPVAEVGEDGARAILFLGELSRITGDERFRQGAERGFLGLTSATPTPSRAAVGLAALAVVRGRAASTRAP